MSLYDAIMTGTAACEHCFAAVHLENVEKHAAWHAHIDNMFNAASGGRKRGMK